MIVDRARHQRNRSRNVQRTGPCLSPCQRLSLSRETRIAGPSTSTGRIIPAPTGRSIVEQRLRYLRECHRYDHTAARTATSDRTLQRPAAYLGSGRQSFRALLLYYVQSTERMPGVRRTVIRSASCHTVPRYFGQQMRVSGREEQNAARRAAAVAVSRDPVAGPRAVAPARGTGGITSGRKNVVSR